MLLTIALCAAAVYFLLPADNSNDFVAPSASFRGASGIESTMVGQQAQSRSLKVSMAADDFNRITAPRKINLLFIGLLAGTAAIGLLSLLFYGAYSGIGSA